MDVSLPTSPESLATFATLFTLELVLGIDNLLFITMMTDRLPERHRRLGRVLGLAGALVGRVCMLFGAAALVHMTAPLFQLRIATLSVAPSARDVVLLAGGAYLVYKGLSELHALMQDGAGGGAVASGRRPATLPGAVATIIVMDAVFSVDSVITAVGLADDLIVMCAAVMAAAVVMIAFVNPISRFIERHEGVKRLCLAFIAAVGALLVLDSMHLNSGIVVMDMHLEKALVYAAMACALTAELASISLRRARG